MAGQYKATHGQYFIYLTSKAIDYVRTFFIPLFFLQETLLVKSKNVQPLPPLVWLYLTVGCSYWVCGVFNQRQQSKSSHSLHTSSISNFQSHQIHEESIAQQYTTIAHVVPFTEDTRKNLIFYVPRLSSSATTYIWHRLVIASDE